MDCSIESAWKYGRGTGMDSWARSWYAVSRILKQAVSA